MPRFPPLEPRSCFAISRPSYAATRDWATAIRRWVPTAQGFEWRSRRYQEELAYVFYEPRTGPDDFGIVSSIPADSGSGLATIEAILQAHLAVFA